MAVILTFYDYDETGFDLKLKRTINDLRGRTKNNLD